jgi:tetratricopeptide (TPR) repeat protein
MISNNIAKSHYQSGYNRMISGQVQDSITDYNLAISLCPDMIEAYLYRGIAYLLLGHYRAAVENYSCMIAQFPDEPILYVWRATAWVGLNQNQEAITDANYAAHLYQIQGYLSKQQQMLELIERLQL